MINRSFLLLVTFVVFGGQMIAKEVRLTADERPLLLVHYMPWHQTPAVSGYWGWHWTMNHFDPEKIDENGRREIASQYYPLTGPYDSNDEDILEYQVLLMKLSGIDGVMVDWYGYEPFWDYGVIDNSTHALFDAVQKAKLLFSIVYEDQTVKNMVDNGHLQKEEAVAHGRQVMLYLQQHWFDQESYLKIENRPVLLTFGPQYFLKSPEWEEMFSALDVPPLFFTLNNRLSPAATGAYPWPPMWKTTPDGILTQEDLDDYFADFYQKAGVWDVLITSAFPAFFDIYKEAGVSEGYGFLDPEDGATFISTLQKALANNPDIIQLVTWNDYGEGTIIEPTEEFGYRYLEIVRDIRVSTDPAFEFRSGDLRLPIRIYRLRSEYPGDSGINSVLDDVFALIVAGHVDSAVDLVDSLYQALGIHRENNHPPIGYDLEQNYPNPFNPSTTILYRLPIPSAVDISVYNLQGQKVETLVDEWLGAGDHSVRWTADGLSSGIYLYRIRTGGFSSIKKCLKLE